MGILSDKRVAKLGGHTIEVRGNNHLLRGLIYRLLLDGDVVAEEQNFWKIPTSRTLEARVSVDGVERHLVASVRQGMLSCDYSLTIDGESVPLELVE